MKITIDTPRGKFTITRDQAIMCKMDTEPRFYICDVFGLNQFDTDTILAIQAGMKQLLK